MPSVKTITPILGDRYYHIFNRGSNKQNIFYSPENYVYFLHLMDQFLAGYVDFLAYCLLPNHFHLIIKTKEKLELAILDEVENRSFCRERFSKQIIDDVNVIGKIIVNRLKRMFITYSMAINKQENRVGNLFDPKYKRLMITDDNYLRYAIFYAHYNPEKHKLIDDFKSYRFSSYKALVGNSKIKMDREFVYELFGDKSSFINYHSVLHDEQEQVIME
ncbi:MAG: transposase [Prolixibacteraceae bacterium]